MIAAMLILLQAAVPMSSPKPKPASLDVVQPVRPQRAIHAACPRQDDADGDIIVCGRVDPDAQYRLRPLTSRYDPVGGPGIGMRVGQGQANLYAVQTKSPDGKPDKRIMVTLKLPF